MSNAAADDRGGQAICVEIRVVHLIPKITLALVTFLTLAAAVQVPARSEEVSSQLQLAALPDVVAGFGLRTLGRTAVRFANGISSLLYALLIPPTVICVTLLYVERRDQSNAVMVLANRQEPATGDVPALAQGRA